MKEMFDSIAPRYDLVNRIITFGLDTGWRKRTVAALGLGPGSVVADLASGTGDLCRVLLKAGLRPVGLDMSLGMLVHANTRTARAQADALCLPLADGIVDGTTCGFALRNFVALPPVFDEMARVVRAGGRIALLDVSVPTNPFLRSGHAFYFGKVVPRIGATLSDPSAYRYLPESVAYLPPAPEIVGDLERAGFRDVEHRLLAGGVAQLISATRS